MTDVADRAGPAPGRRDRNRERLYAAALDLFAERGYEATTMDEVAARAGLSRRSAFNHFPAKSDLTVEWVARRRATALDMVGDHAAAVDVADRLRTWFRALAELTEARPGETEQVMLGWLAAGGPVRHPTGTAEAVAPWLEAGVRDGVLGADVDPVAGAELLVDAYYGVLHRWLGTPPERRDPLVPQIGAVVDLVLRGLVARPVSPGRVGAGGRVAP